MLQIFANGGLCAVGHSKVGETRLKPTKKEQREKQRRKQHQHKQHLTISVVDATVSSILELDF